MKKHEGHIVIRHPLRVDTVAVRKVEQPFQVVEFLLLPQLLHIVEYRPEIRRPESRQFSVRKKIVKGFPPRDLRILPHLAVTLQDVHIDLGKKVLPVLQNIVGLLQESLHDLTPAGGRGIKRDHEIPDLIAVLILQRLHQRQITVGLQPIGIIDIVEFIVIDLHRLPHDHEFPQKIGIVIAFSRGLFQILLNALGVVPVPAETL